MYVALCSANGNVYRHIDLKLNFWYHNQMLVKLLFQIIVGILGIFLAIRFVNGVEFTGTIQIVFIAGGILGLVNFFIKPALKTITFPLRILTFGLFGLVINMLLIWLVVDIFSPIEIEGIISLLWTTVIIWFLNLIFEKVYKNIRRRKYSYK